MKARRILVLITIGSLSLAGCVSSGTTPGLKAAPETSTASPHAGHGDGKAVESAALRKGEHFLDLAMPGPYTPKAPTYGTDDYRCFLLDPKLADPAFVTGVDVLPGRPELVHHVILFQVSPEAVATAKAEDAKAPGEGWTCFGGTGLDGGPGVGLDSAPWLSAWAPGGGESLLEADVGIPLEPGSQVVMQVHYNLLAGKGADTSKARLRLTSGKADLDPLQTMLMPGPVELACRPGRTGKLCDREAAVTDVVGRFGQRAGQIVAGLQLLCGGNMKDPKASPTQHCDRTIGEASTVRAVAGHMHLLGRSIKIELNPGKPGARTLLDLPVWDFDNQAARPLKTPAKLKRGDVLRVTCKHDQTLRDKLPALKGQPERYVVWGEGTTDEMCLGIVLMTKR